MNNNPQNRRNTSQTGNASRKAPQRTVSQNNGRVQKAQSPQNTRRQLQSTKSSSATITLNKKTVRNAVIVILVLMNIIFFSLITRRSIPEILSRSQVEENSAAELLEKIDSPFTKASVSTADYKRGTLILVNTENTYDFDYPGKDIPLEAPVRVTSLIQNRTFKASNNNTLLCETTISALNSMFADFYAETGKNDVMINSAHRTYEDQQSILKSKIAQLGENQQIAQLPGASEHHTGYAFDISVYPDGGVGARTFTGDGVYSWIYENCARYGFILRYPEGKTYITGIAPESWHFRYVGFPHSVYIYEKGLTLEEYISLLPAYTEEAPLKINTSDTESYCAYYVPKSDSDTTEFNVPKYTDYFISGTNAGGFIVWYKTHIDMNEPEKDFVQ